MKNLDLKKMGTMALAVAVGVVVYKLVSKATNMSSSTEGFLGAGGQCGAQGSPGGFQADSSGCQFLMNCEESGGTGSATSSGANSWSLECVGGSGMSSVDVNLSGGSATRPVINQKMSPAVTLRSPRRRKNLRMFM